MPHPAKDTHQLTPEQMRRVVEMVPIKNWQVDVNPELSRNGVADFTMFCVPPPRGIGTLFISWTRNVFSGELLDIHVYACPKGIGSDGPAAEEFDRSDKGTFRGEWVREFYKTTFPKIAEAHAGKK